jgi:hypothetical protein
VLTVLQLVFRQPPVVEDEIGGRREPVFDGNGKRLAERRRNVVRERERPVKAVEANEDEVEDEVM